MRRILILAAALLGAPFASADVPYNDQCTPVSGIYGRDYFDYLDPANKQRLAIVEEYHFTPDIENLIKGITGLVPGELDFVLRALPNHHRALIAMARWQRQHPKLADSLEGRVYTIDCYLKRATWVNAKDGTVRMIYGTVLYQQGKVVEADKEYALAEELGVGGAELYYNRGLLKLQMGDVESARSYADKAYQEGYPLNGLREKLAALELRNIQTPSAPAVSSESRGK